MRFILRALQRVIRWLTEPLVEETSVVGVNTDIHMTETKSSGYLENDAILFEAEYYAVFKDVISEENVTSSQYSSNDSSFFV